MMPFDSVNEGVSCVVYDLARHMMALNSMNRGAQYVVYEVARHMMPLNSINRGVQYMVYDVARRMMPLEIMSLDLPRVNTWHCAKPATARYASLAGLNITRATFN